MPRHLPEHWPEVIKRIWWTLASERACWPGGLRARLRSLLHPFWETEMCGQCGRRVGPHTGSWWSADDDLWFAVVGTFQRVLCPPCFTARAEAKGLFVYWEPRAWKRESRATTSVATSREQP